MSLETTSGTRTWAEHLAALEAAVERARAAVRDSAVDVDLELDPLRSPAPPHPPEQRDARRARTLLQDLEMLIGEMDVARSRVARELRLHRRLAADRQQDASSLYLDGRC